jgi:hypothetical protein
MKSQEWFSQQLKEFENDPEYLAEKLRIDLIEEFLEIMEEDGVSRTELARRLGCSMACITKPLNGKENFTLLKLAQIGVALGRKVQMAFVPAEAAKTKARPARKSRIDASEKATFASPRKTKVPVSV